MNYTNFSFHRILLPALYVGPVLILFQPSNLIFSITYQTLYIAFIHAVIVITLSWILLKM